MDVLCLLVYGLFGKNELNISPGTIILRIRTSFQTLKKKKKKFDTFSESGEQII